MLRRIEPKAIICYCDPFPEMKGNVITVDYAKTNNLSEHKKFWTFSQDNSCFKIGSTFRPEPPQEMNIHYVIKTSGYVVTAGMGGGGGGGSSGGNSGGVKVNSGQQDKHVPGTNNYNQDVSGGKKPSILKENPKQLLDDFAGTGQKIPNTNKKRVNFGKVIGQYYDKSTGKYVDTTNGIIHYDSRGGAHIVPAKPQKGMRFMDKMFRVISRYPNGTPLTVELKDGGVVQGYIDTMYETNNGLELEDEGYQEFDAWLLAIVDILKHSKETRVFVIGDLMEFSIQNLPAKISLKNGEVIWNQEASE